MPRQPRLVVPFVAHHLTQRGNYGQTIFEDSADFVRYCRWTNAISYKHGFRVLAYCLMPNHVHFIASPEHQDSFARTFQIVHTRYARHANRRRELNGHLWQARFFSCVLDDQHLYRAIRYVERNPVRAGLARVPWEYRWSSAAAHAATGPSPIELTPVYPDRVGAAWKEYIGIDDPALLPRIRATTARGAFLGGEGFLREIETRIGRPVVSRNRGRPRGPDERRDPADNPAGSLARS